MSLLSITFHATDSVMKEWEIFVDETLVLLADNLMDVDRYFLSEVQSEMVNEGKNYNLLLVFANEELREQFVESELENIRDRIEPKFGTEVMIFLTYLNPKKTRP